MSAVGSSDPDTASGDAVRNYVWSWGDGSQDTTGTSASQSKVFPLAGTYTVTLRVIDKWNRMSAPVTMQVTTQTEPAGNQPPVVTFTTTCTARSCAVSSAGTADTDGGIRSYSWNWGDATTNSTGASPSAHVYALAGTYTITLTVIDNWGRQSQTTRSVTVA